MVDGLSIPALLVRENRRVRDFYANSRRGDLGGGRDARATRFHMTMPGYAPTRLARAPRTAASLGLERLFVKLEIERFGLPSFKVLGASWATCRALSAHAGLDEPVATFGRLQLLAERLGDITLVAATDGNHGRAVAHMARLLGLSARIFVPEDMAVARVNALAGEGAQVEIVRGDYDDAVALSAAAASDTALVISDTSWPGYREVPAWVADGYGTIFAELEHQLHDPVELVTVQIGVGALASATVRALAGSGRFVLGVEPGDADCALRAVRDGENARASGPHRSVMVGLNCGSVSPIALPDLRAGVDAFCAIDDDAVETSVRALLDDDLTCGETGAAGVAGLVALRAAWGEESWSRLGVAPRPAVLAICTEAPTDPESFRRIAGGSGRPAPAA
jgi:diaminopropionate ammonia-lyase